jgi:hypothetical protein
MKHRAYTFRSIWHISAPLATVEKVIEDVENWPIWWKGLKSAQVISLEHTLLGSQAEMVWQGSGGYYLRLTLTITLGRINYKVMDEFLCSTTATNFYKESLYFNGSRRIGLTESV